MTTRPTVNDIITAMRAAALPRRHIEAVATCANEHAELLGALKNMLAAFGELSPSNPAVIRARATVKAVQP